MLIERKMTTNDTEKVMEIWADAVLATHGFLAEKDFAALKEEIPSYFPMLDMLVWEADGEMIGFSGMHEQHLEMLFLSSLSQGKGYGTQILKWLIENKNLQSIDVNEQNTAAKHFYEKNGFKVVGRSETDGQGREYPILHLAR